MTLLIQLTKKQKSEVGAEIGRVLDSKGQNGISILEAHAPFDKMIEKYQRIYAKTPTKENRMDLEFAQKIKDDLFAEDLGDDVINLGDESFGNWFGSKVKEFDSFLWGKGKKKAAPNPITYLENSNAEGGMAIISKLNDYTGIRKPKGLGSDPTIQRLGKVEVDARNASREAAEAVKNSINDAIGPEYVGLKDKYKKMSRVGDIISENFKTDKKAEATLNSFFSPKKSVTRKHILEASELLGSNVNEKAKEIAAVGIFAKADEDIGQWTLQSAARKAPASVIGAGLGYWGATALDATKGAAIPIGAASGVIANKLVSPHAMRAYMSGGKEN